jgi:hypothetical protein
VHANTAIDGLKDRSPHSPRTSILQAVSQNIGQRAKFRRALGRSHTREAQTRELLSGEEAFGADVQALPEAMRQKIQSSRTETLLDLLKAEDAKVQANTKMLGYVVRVLVTRLGGLESAREAGVPEWALALRQRGKQPDDTHLFVGWVDSDGQIRWQDDRFHPSRPQEMAPELLQRIEKLDGCGGVFGRTDDSETQVRAERLRHTMDKWRGRSLKTLGAVAPDRIKRSVGAVASASLRRFLEADALDADACMLALDGKQVVLLSATGDVYKLNSTETKHLALKGLLPRHWFLPLQWWKDKKVEEMEQDKDDKKGRVRVYKGKYDDEQEVGFDEEKDGYGE